MKLYVAICEDRHSDSVVRVFDTPNKAIAYAKNFMNENCSHPEYIEFEDVTDINGWLFSCTYSAEGDSVWVEETWLNDVSDKGETK